MNIFIPSYKRVDMFMNATLSWVPESLLPVTHIVVRDEEQELYSKKLATNKEYDKVKILAFNTNGISNKRLQIANHCIQNNISHFIMMDDDLKFFKRKDPSTTSLVKAEPEDMIQAIVTMRRCLSNFSHVGISTRQGNNNAGVGSPDILVEQNTRCIRAVAFRTKDYVTCDIDRINGMEDLDVSLQLLRQGKKNLNLFYWAQDQGMTNAPGGCSEWRTHDYHMKNAVKLARLHYPFVELVEKVNKTGGEFGERLEVRIAWKQAYKEGVKNASRIGSVDQRIVSQRDGSTTPV